MGVLRKKEDVDNSLFLILFCFVLIGCGSGGTEEQSTLDSLSTTPVGLVLSKNKATTSSATAKDTFTVKLKTSENVNVAISNDNTSVGSISKEKLEFNKSNWNKEQTITVTGICDNATSNNSTYNLILNPSSKNYNTSHKQTVEVTDKDEAGFKISEISGNLYERGDNASFSIRLCSLPTSNVSIPISINDTTEGKLFPNSNDNKTLIFSPDNWTTVQTVSVYFVDDDLSDDDEEFKVVLGNVISNDTNYNNKNPSDVTVINKDNDTAGVNISKTELLTSEAGGTDNFTVDLAKQPDANVTVNASVSNTSIATISPSSITFSDASDNYSTKQTFVVTGVDDNIDNVGDNESFTVNFSITSTVTAYSSLSLSSKSISGTNMDNDTAEILIDNNSTKNVSEFGNSTYIYVKLSTIPTQTVNIGISSDNETQGTVYPSNLSIIPSNWNKDNTVTVTGVDDDISDGTVIFNILFDNASSSDPKYNNLAPNQNSIPVKNIDDGND